MTSESAILAEGLGKSYRLGERDAYKTLRDSIASAFRHRSRSSRSILWALRDVSFEVKDGEAVGIIGRNGAGKSTLLKILARITEPTEGRAVVWGRAGALLEVGTGFHPELTGRENVFLNGSLLGMRRSEVAKRFDEIVAFADVEGFVDTPVKRFSSGMQMRLAFAVAAHLEPEILIVDEVLAVGDAAFQRKCLNRMEAASAEGRTVLFVSHNLQAVRTLCHRAVVLEEGKVAFDGDSTTAIEHYLALVEPSRDGSDLTEAPRRGEAGGDVSIVGAELLSESGRTAVPLGAPFQIRLSFVVERPISDLVIGFSIFSIDEVVVMQSLSTATHAPFGELEPGRYEVVADLGRNVLAPGHYSVEAGARDARKQQDLVPHALTFEVVDLESDVESPWFGHTAGVVRVPVRWQRPMSAHPGSGSDKTSGVSAG